MRIKPVFDVIKDSGVTDKREFALCLGKNGGRFTIGGYEESLQANANERVEWFPLNQPMSHYKIQLDKVMIGNVVLPNPPSRAFLDSGTTFAYLSSSQKKALDKAILGLCNSGEYGCLGTRT